MLGLPEIVRQNFYEETKGGVRKFLVLFHILMWKSQIADIDFGRTNCKFVSFYPSLYRDMKQVPNRPHLAFWEHHLRSIPKYSAATDQKIQSKILETGFSPLWKSRYLHESSPSSEGSTLWGLFLYKLG